MVAQLIWVIQCKIIKYILKVVYYKFLSIVCVDYNFVLAIFTVS